MALVFQYGSNVSIERINSANRLRGDAQFVALVHTVHDHELEFSVWSKNNHCAAANIVQGYGRKIWGVLYDIPDFLIHRTTAGCRKSLDEIEGECQNYKRKKILIRYANERPVEEDVLTYVVKDRKIGIPTSFEYAKYIISGLRNLNVSEDYIEYVKRKVLEDNPNLRSKIVIL